MKSSIPKYIPRVLIVVSILLIVVWWFWPRKIEGFVNKESIEKIEIQLIVVPEKHIVITDSKEVSEFYDKMNSYSFHRGVLTGGDGMSCNVMIHLKDERTCKISFNSMLCIDGWNYSLNTGMLDEVRKEIKKRG